MRRPSSLDRMVQNFQHNWETNPQFRALWSGGLGLAIVVVMCACLGFAFTFAGAAASAFGGNTPTTSFSAPSGTVRPGSIDSTVVFPTQTVPSWGAQNMPASAPIPPSLTPAPSPTALPTPTAVPTAPAGPGNGGGGGGGCGGCSVTFDSATLKGGTTGSVTIHTSVPNSIVNVFVKPGTANWTSPQNAGSTNGNGDGTIPIANVPPGCNGTVSLWIVTNNSGSTSASATCTP